MRALARLRPHGHRSLCSGISRTPFFILCHSNSQESADPKYRTSNSSCKGLKWVLVGPSIRFIWFPAVLVSVNCFCCAFWWCSLIGEILLSLNTKLNCVFVLRVCVKFCYICKFDPLLSLLVCSIEQEARLFKKTTFLLLFLNFYFKTIQLYLLVGQNMQKSIFQEKTKLRSYRKIKCCEKEAANTTEEQLPMADFYF